MGNPGSSSSDASFVRRLLLVGIVVVSIGFGLAASQGYWASPQESYESTADRELPAAPAALAPRTGQLVGDEPPESGAQEPQQLILGGYPDSWPYLMMEGNEPDGLCVRIAREAFSRAGYQVTFKLLPFKRLLHEARAGRMGVVGFYHNSERAKEFDYTDPICLMNLRAFGRREELARVDSLQDLRGMSVAVARGPSYGPEIDEAIASGSLKAVLVNGFDSVQRVLAAGRVDLAFDTASRGNLLLEGLDEADKYGMSEWIVSSNDMHVAFPKSMRAQTPISAFNKALATMKSDGSYQAIAAEFSLNEPFTDVMPAAPPANDEPIETSRK